MTQETALTTTTMSTAGHSELISGLPTAGRTELVATKAPARNQNPALVYLAGLGPGSRRTMAQALETVAELVNGGRCIDIDVFPWQELRFAHTAAIRAALAEKYRPATANKMLAALRGTLKAAWRLGQLDGETYQRAADIGNIKAETLPAGRALSSGELVALFRACGEDTSAAGARDAALVALLYAGGLRRSEAVALELDDYDTETGALTIRGGKGRKDRISYAQNGASIGYRGLARPPRPRVRRSDRPDRPEGHGDGAAHDRASGALTSCGREPHRPR